MDKTTMLGGRGAPRALAIVWMMALCAPAWAAPARAPGCPGAEEASRAIGQAQAAANQASLAALSDDEVGRYLRASAAKDRAVDDVGAAMDKEAQAERFERDAMGLRLSQSAFAQEISALMRARSAALQACRAAR